MTRRSYNAAWQRIRDRVLRERDWTCERCGHQSYINTRVHHLTYDRAGGDELDTDLQVLCLPCHYDVHSGNDTRGFRYSQRASQAPETSVKGQSAFHAGWHTTNVLVVS